MLGFSTVKFLFSLFPLISLEGSHSAQPLKEWKVRFHYLDDRTSISIFGYSLHVIFVYFPLFVYLITFLYQHGSTHIHLICWVIIQHWVLSCSTCSILGYWGHFFPYDIPTLCLLLSTSFVALQILAHPMYFLVQF